MTDDTVSARHLSDMPVAEVRLERRRIDRPTDMRLAVVLALLVWVAILTPLFWLFP